MSLSSAKILAAGLGFALALLAGSAAQEKSAAPAGQAIEITIPRRFEPVDFAREVLPILKKNCLACHNKTTAKEDLILETPADMLKGGESGPAIVPEHGEQSLMFKMAAHQKRPFMPPHENKVAATDLTPEQLGLIKLWIDQGAKNSVATNPPVVWQKMPAALNPIFAVAITGNGEFAACARANQISVYHLPTREIVAQMADPQLGSLYPDSPPAHRDLVESLAFNPEGNLLASGSFREVKLWRRPVNPRVRSWPTLAQRPITAATASSDGKWLVAGDDRGRVVVTSLENPKQSRAFDAHKGLTTGLAFSADGARLVSISADKGVAVWSVSEGRRLALGTAASALNAVTWLPDQRLATAGADGAIRLWQLPASPGKSAPLQEVASFHAHDGAVTALAFSGQLVSGGTDGNVVFWNLEKQEPSKKLAFGSQVACVAAQANGKRVAAAGTNGTTKLWSVPKGDLIAEFKGDWRLREASESKSREVEFQKGEVAYFQGQLDLREKEHKDALERLKKAAEGRSAAEKTLTEKQAVAREAEEAKI
ncbi:MAG TPA: c-type cytochrome domain-containing protein, partial [Verrucomicrobiae bacterium]|nr:c-type cytochrome domain-containing protein [Verrucomicrobiae bacterium]